MKIKPEDLRIIKDAVEKVIKNNPQVTLAAYQAKGLTDLRWRFDLFHAAQRYMPSGFVTNLYKYMNDSTIDTVLRSLTKSQGSSKTESFVAESHMDDLNALMSRVKRSGDKGSIKFVTSLIAAVKDGDKDAAKGIIHFNKGEANLVPASVSKWIKESADMDIQELLLGEAKKMSEEDILALIKQALQAALGGDHDNARSLYSKLFGMGLASSNLGAKVDKAFTDYLATLRKINFQHGTTAEEDARLTHLLGMAKEAIDGSPQDLRKARTLVNQAKMLASITLNRALRSQWSDLNYYLKGVTVRKPKPDLNRGFQGVHDPRSYGRGGLADSHEPEGDDIQEDEWGGGFQSYADAHREVQAGLKADYNRERSQKLKWIVQVIRGQITKQKFKKLTGSNFDELMQRSPYFRNQIKRMSKKALAPVNPPAPAAPTTESADIHEKVEIDGRTRAYRNTVMRLEQARRLREGRAKEMQENKFGGLYDDGSGRGAMIPAPIDINFHEAMKIVEKYRTLREKKKTLFGAPKGKMEDLEAAVAMKNGKFSMSETEMSPKQKEYRAFFAKALKKFGHKSPADMDDGEKKKFFNWIEKNWKG